MTARKLVLTLLLAVVAVCFTGCGGTTTASNGHHMSGEGQTMMGTM
ncbi:MAG: hypothetical protein JWN30_1016 [Bacilli bacterium]|nr:hypothetical protein [Bacilli bacterium]